MNIRSLLTVLALVAAMFAAPAYAQSAETSGEAAASESAEKIPLASLADSGIDTEDDEEPEDCE